MTNHCILIADDEPEILSKNEQIFVESGFTVICCANGLEAWDQLVLNADEIVALRILQNLPEIRRPQYRVCADVVAIVQLVFQRRRR